MTPSFWVVVYIIVEQILMWRNWKQCSPASSTQNVKVHCSYVWLGSKISCSNTTAQTRASVSKCVWGDTWQSAIDQDWSSGYKLFVHHKEKVFGMQLCSIILTEQRQCCDLLRSDFKHHCGITGMTIDLVSRVVYSSVGFSITVSV